MLEYILLMGSFSMINGRYHYIYLILQIFMDSLLYVSNAVLSTGDNSRDNNGRNSDFD